ncbi:MAG TPA: alpha/beta fold hydrolase [Bryobacteraceae bacterium]|nr:alpha/beta fold hydrolase [Bryobacteraceae bacterium]
MIARKPARRVPPFEPLFRSPHLQTVLSHYWRRPALERSFPIESRYFRTESDVQVLVESQWPSHDPRGEIVMVHGLEGSSRAGYIASLSGAALRAGFAVQRFNMRTCGGTERLCPTLYHAGLTSDLLSVICQRRHGKPLHLVGFSLGGNVVVKLAGELRESGPDLLAGVCAVSAPLDLAACSRRMSRLDNLIYEWRFVRRMRQRLCATGRYNRAAFSGLRSVAAIDDRITAPSFGFGDASNYYRTQSAMRFLDGLRVPVLLIYSRDDTLVPSQTFDDAAIRGNPWIECLPTDHGGHLGFLGRHPHRFWLDEAIMEWISRTPAS